MRIYYTIDTGMSENTVFANNGQSSQTEPQSTSPSNEHPHELSVDDGSGFHFPVGMIIKIVGGILALLLIVVLMVRVILPLFTPKDQKVTLVYWGLWDDPPIMQSIIDDFERANPTITIQYEKQDIKAIS